MPYRTFLTYTVIGGLLWGPGFVLLGYSAGSSYQKVADVTGPASLVLLMLVVLISVVTVAARWIAAHQDRIQTAVARQLDRPAVVALRQRYDRQLAFLARRLTPGGAQGLSLTIGLAVIIAGGWAFGGVLEDVLGREELASQDSPIAAWLVGHRTGWLTTAMQAITTLGSGWVTLPLLLLGGLLLARSGQRRQTTIMVILVGVGTSALVIAIKLLISRTRPDITDLLTIAPGYAFPSGHSAQAAATYATLAYLLSARLKRWRLRVAVWAVALLVVLLVGFSRLYLGAHWLTDVLGGYTLAAAWTALVITATAAIRSTRATAPDQ